MLDRVTPRGKMRDELISILRMLTGEPPAIMGDLPVPTSEELAAGSPTEKPTADTEKTR
jgi:acetyl-CoA carboxylase carboxyl transferase subunit beta